MLKKYILRVEAACKNPHRHSAAGVGFPTFLFRLKNQKRRSLGLQSQDDRGRLNGKH